MLLQNHTRTPVMSFVYCIMKSFILFSCIMLCCAEKDNVTELMWQTVQVAELDTSVNIQCSQDGLDADESVLYWILNDNTKITTSTGRVKVDNNGTNITIEVMQWSSYGKYYCPRETGRWDSWVLRHGTTNPWTGKVWKWGKPNYMK